MYRTVRDRIGERHRVPAFGDYAIASPLQAVGAGFAPAPQIRYTVAENWLVLKGRKANRPGNFQFLDICDRVSTHPEFTRELSWGDRQIEEKARYAHTEPVPTAVTPGNAMVWRAIGTSHHMALVIDTLTRAGGP
jgi:hypothetical protein